MARKVVKDITKEEAFALADDVAREIVANRALVAERDAAIQAIQDKFNPLIEAADKGIDAKIAQVAVFARANRGEFFSEKKSCETPLSVMSFRYGNPTLKTLSGKDTWEDVVQLLKDDREGRKFVKVKEEADKRGLLKKEADWLAKFRLRVTQSETFAIDPKTDVIA